MKRQIKLARAIVELIKNDIVNLVETIRLYIKYASSTDFVLPGEPIPDPPFDDTDGADEWEW